MLQLIPKQKIEEAARSHCNIKQDLIIDEEERYYKDFKKYDGFNAGVDFTLKEVEPFTCEFAEWIELSDYKRCLRRDIFRWYNPQNDLIPSVTTQQLLQQFIEERNK